MTDDQRLARQQARVAELGGGLVRAVCGDRDLHFRGGRLHRGRTALPWFAPHLHPPPAIELAEHRGVADGLALRLAGSDPVLHARLAPAEPLERMLFELLEQFRAESLVPAAMPGMRANLRQRHVDWSLEYHHGGGTDSARGLLLYAVVQICRARVFGEAVVEETEDLLEATRAALSPRLGHAFAGLRRTRDDQSAYAAHARTIAARVAEMLTAEDDGDAGAAADTGERDVRGVFELVAEMDRAVIEGHATVAAGRSAVLAAADGDYRVFTRDYDIERDAATLVRRPLLATYRAQLDRRIAGEHLNLARLARELQMLLAEPAPDGWDSAQEDGRIDGRRLAQLVASPTERRLFRTERSEPLADCIVTLLIDCSGSMRQHAETVAMIADVLARTLEAAGVASEVLGFTTAAWNGGRALRDWQRAGRPQHPGRLNERCHLVFKSADTAWRRARPALAALLRPELYREGLDGEAVDWACARQAALPQSRRLLLVVSDGSPMDSATSLANDAGYLDHHLQDVVARHERAGTTAIIGLGVGLDLSPYYRHGQVLDFGVLTGPAIFREIVALIAGRHRR
ncbi:MAG: cobalt chelatase [Lautropia sp.]